MKAKITKGNNFKGVLEYALDKKKGAEIIGGNMHGTTPTTLATEFESIAQLKKIKKPVYHKSLSQPPGEQNKLSDEYWNEIVKRDLEKSGFDLNKTQYVIIRHKDKKHDHVHVILNKIDIEGNVFKDGNDVYKAIQTSQEIEIEFNLTRTPGREKPAKKRPTKAEREKAAREGAALTPRELLQNIIDKALADGKPLSAREFRDRLDAEGVELHANIAKTGKINGFSFEIDDIRFKGSSLGKKYTYQSLKKRGLTFDQADRNALSTQKSEEITNESGDITKILDISGRSVLDMHILGTATILDTQQQRAGNAAILQQSQVEDTNGQGKKTVKLQHTRSEVKQIHKSDGDEEQPKRKFVPRKYTATDLFGSRFAAAETDPRSALDAGDQGTPAPPDSHLLKIEQMGRMDNRRDAPPQQPFTDQTKKAKVTFNHIVTALQYKQPGHMELRQSLPELVQMHADRIVKLKDYHAQQQATNELFKSSEGIKIADMLLDNKNQQSISRN